MLNCKILIISCGLIFAQQIFLVGLFLGDLFSEGLIIGGHLALASKFYGILVSNLFKNNLIK